jgi:hypothetical protein
VSILADNASHLFQLANNRTDLGCSYSHTRLDEESTMQILGVGPVSTGNSRNVVNLAIDRLRNNCVSVRVIGQVQGRLQKRCRKVGVTRQSSLISTLFAMGVKANSTTKAWFLCPWQRLGLTSWPQLAAQRGNCDWR